MCEGANKISEEGFVLKLMEQAKIRTTPGRNLKNFKKIGVKKVKANKSLKNQDGASMGQSMNSLLRQSCGEKIFFRPTKDEKSMAVVG